MVDREVPRRETLSGLPYITADEIKAFNDKPRDFSQDLDELTLENPELAYDITSGINGTNPDYLLARRMMATGAIRMYMILRGKAVLNTLAEIEGLTANDGDVGGADPQPSA